MKTRVSLIYFVTHCGYVILYSVIMTKFVVFELLSYCFKEAKGFGEKVSFARPPLSRLMKPGSRWYNKRVLSTDYSVPQDFLWMKITNWIARLPFLNP